MGKSSSWLKSGKRPQNTEGRSKPRTPRVKPTAAVPIEAAKFAYGVLSSLESSWAEQVQYHEISLDERGLSEGRREILEARFRAAKDYHAEIKQRTDQLAAALVAAGVPRD